MKGGSTHVLVSRLAVSRCVGGFSLAAVRCRTVLLLVVVARHLVLRCCGSVFTGADCVRRESWVVWEEGWGASLPLNQVLEPHARVFRHMFRGWIHVFFLGNPTVNRHTPPTGSKMKQNLEVADGTMRDRIAHQLFRVWVLSPLYCATPELYYEKLHSLEEELAGHNEILK